MDLWSDGVRLWALVWVDGEAPTMRVLRRLEVPERSVESDGALRGHCQRKPA